MWWKTGWNYKILQNSTLYKNMVEEENLVEKIDNPLQKHGGRKKYPDKPSVTQSEPATFISKLSAEL